MFNDGMIILWQASRLVVYYERCITFIYTSWVDFEIFDFLHTTVSIGSNKTPEPAILGLYQQILFVYFLYGCVTKLVKYLCTVSCLCTVNICGNAFYHLFSRLL